MWINKQGQCHVYPLNTIGDDTSYKQWLLTLGLISIDSVKATFKAAIQLESNFLHLSQWRHFKYQFLHLNRPRITEEKFTNSFFYSNKWIGEYFYDQVLCGNKPLFGAVYLMVTDSQASENQVTFISEYGAPTNLGCIFQKNCIYSITFLSY